MWSMSNYGNSKDRWTITDGRVRFDIHQQISGENGAYIVTPEQATRYAHRILAALNAAKEINIVYRFFKLLKRSTLNIWISSRSRG